MLFVEEVREYLATLPDNQPGWLAGLRDPRIGKALAALQLRETDLGIGQIAFQVGYESEPAFGRAFRKAFKCTPGQ